MSICTPSSLLQGDCEEAGSLVDTWTSISVVKINSGNHTLQAEKNNFVLPGAGKSHPACSSSSSAKNSIYWCIKFTLAHANSIHAHLTPPLPLLEREGRSKKSPQ